MDVAQVVHLLLDRVGDAGEHPDLVLERLRRCHPRELLLLERSDFFRALLDVPP